MGTKASDKSDDPAAVAMEMTPDEVQWLKVPACFVNFGGYLLLINAELSDSLSLSLSLSGYLF